MEAGDGYDEIEKALDDSHHKAKHKAGFDLPEQYSTEDLGDFDASIFLGHTSPVSPHREQSPVCSLLRFWLQILVG